jgi:hypothetical protein
VLLIAGHTQVAAKFELTSRGRQLSNSSSKHNNRSSRSSSSSSSSSSSYSSSDSTRRRGGSCSSDHFTADTTDDAVLNGKSGEAPLGVNGQSVQNGSEATEQQQPQQQQQQQQQQHEEQQLRVSVSSDDIRANANSVQHSDAASSSRQPVAAPAAAVAVAAVHLTPPRSSSDKHRHSNNSSKQQQHSSSSSAMLPTVSNSHATGHNAIALSLSLSRRFSTSSIASTGSGFSDVDSRRSSFRVGAFPAPLSALDNGGLAAGCYFRRYAILLYYCYYCSTSLNSAADVLMRLAVSAGSGVMAVITLAVDCTQQAITPCGHDFEVVIMLLSDSSNSKSAAQCGSCLLCQ